MIGWTGVLVMHKVRKSESERARETERGREGQREREREDISVVCMGGWVAFRVCVVGVGRISPSPLLSPVLSFSLSFSPTKKSIRFNRNYLYVFFRVANEILYYTCDFYCNFISCSSPFVLLFSKCMSVICVFNVRAVLI